MGCSSDKLMFLCMNIKACLTSKSLKINNNANNKLGMSCAKLRANLTWLGFIWCKLPSFDKFYFKKIILNFDSQKIGIIQTLGQKIVKLKKLSGQKNLVQKHFGKKMVKQNLVNKKIWSKNFGQKFVCQKFFGQTNFVVSNKHKICA